MLKIVEYGIFAVCLLMVLALIVGAARNRPQSPSQPPSDEPGGSDGSVAPPLGSGQPR